MEDSFDRERNSSGVSDRSIRRESSAASVPDTNERRILWMRNGLDLRQEKQRLTEKKKAYR